MKKTILQIAKYYHPVEGGIETVTKYMGEGLKTFENVIVCFSQDGITCRERMGVYRGQRLLQHIGRWLYVCKASCPES